MLEETQALTDREIERVYIDKGYRGQNAPNPLRVYRSGQKRGAHGQVKRELRRRSAIAKQTATWVGTFSRAVSATPSTPS
jgi:IS5 family transposase